MSLIDPAIGLRMTYGFTQIRIVAVVPHRRTRQDSAFRSVDFSQVVAWKMVVENQHSAAGKRDFRVSPNAVATLAEQERTDFDPDTVELPRVYGASLLFAIARDPRTIFTYWCIDWPSIFKNTEPVDRQVHLRVYRSDGAEETSTPAEPMAGQSYLSVSRPGGAYRVEIGYYAPEGVWNSVATSDEIAMPRNTVAESADVDLATIPFHLSFQRLIDLFRAESASDALMEIISRLQNRAVTEDERDLLNPEEWEILRAMDLSLDDLKSDRGAFATRVTAAALRRRAETLLGFGATSPLRAFSESSSR